MLMWTAFEVNLAGRGAWFWVPAGVEGSEDASFWY